MTELPQDLFKNNKNLKELDLHNNKLKNFDGKIFQSIPALRELILLTNEIETFSFENMPVLQNLTQLWLSDNILEDFDVEAVKKKFPRIFNNMSDGDFKDYIGMWNSKSK